MAASPVSLARGVTAAYAVPNVPKRIELNANLGFPGNSVGQASHSKVVWCQRKKKKNKKDFHKSGATRLVRKTSPKARLKVRERAHGKGDAGEGGGDRRRTSDLSRVLRGQPVLPCPRRRKRFKNSKPTKCRAAAKVIPLPFDRRLARHWERPKKSREPTL